MANHLTPDELSDALGISRKTLLSLCVQEGVPVFHGRIDKTLFVQTIEIKTTHAVRLSILMRFMLSLQQPFVIEGKDSGAKGTTNESANRSEIIGDSSGGGNAGERRA